MIGSLTEGKKRNITITRQKKLLSGFSVASLPLLYPCKPLVINTPCLLSLDTVFPFVFMMKDTAGEATLENPKRGNKEWYLQ